MPDGTKAVIEDTDMPENMQLEATSLASQALDLFDVVDCENIAGHIRKEFVKRHGPAGWQCKVGSNIGCFFTHKQATFIYFSLGTLHFLIYSAFAYIAA